LLPTTHLSTPKGWKAELAWLADLERTVYPHKWSPVSRRSSAGPRKFACQRPTFYRCATQPTLISLVDVNLTKTHISGIFANQLCVADIRKWKRVRKIREDRLCTHLLRIFGPENFRYQIKNVGGDKFGARHLPSHTSSISALRYPNTRRWCHGYTGKHTIGINCSNLVVAACWNIFYANCTYCCVRVSLIVKKWYLNSSTSFATLI